MSGSNAEAKQYHRPTTGSHPQLEVLDAGKVSMEDYGVPAMIANLGCTNPNAGCTTFSHDRGSGTSYSQESS